VSAQLYQHTQIAPDSTLAVITELEFSDEPITQAFFFFFIIVDLNFPHRRYYNYEKLPTVGGFVQRLDKMSAPTPSIYTQVGQFTSGVSTKKVGAFILSSVMDFSQ